MSLLLFSIYIDLSVALKKCAEFNLGNWSLQPAGVNYYAFSDDLVLLDENAEKQLCNLNFSVIDLVEIGLEMSFNKIKFTIVVRE